MPPACAPLTMYQKNSMRFGFCRACAFLAKKTKSYGFFWQCNFFFFFFGGGGFANVNGPIKIFVLYLPEWASGDKILCSTMIKVRFDSNLILSTLPFSDSPFPFQSCCKLFLQ